ncbi:hypothetical protein AOH119_00770 [Helicobacter pylori]
MCNEKEVIIKHVGANEKNELVDFKFKDKNEAPQFLKDPSFIKRKSIQ